MTVDETNLLNEKAKSKKDGVYSFRGNLWVVKSNRFIAFIKPTGEVLERFGSFNYELGSFNNFPRYEWKNKLIQRFLKN